MIWLKFIAEACLAAYVLALTGLTLNQRNLLYRPGAVIVAPAQAGLPLMQVLQLKSRDGETLNAWFAPPKQDKPLLLYFHGNAGGLADRAERFKFLTDSGYGLLAVSYRGYGGSTGAPTQEGLFQDAEAAFTEAARRGFTERRLVIVGESLGTGPAIKIAAEHRAAALVLDSPYLSIRDVAQSQFPIFPVGLLLLDPYRSDLVIGSVHMPVLMMHGERDSVIPIASARALFDLANEPKTFIAIPDGDHLVLQKDLRRVKAFIDAATEP